MGAQSRGGLPHSGPQTLPHGRVGNCPGHPKTLKLEATTHPAEPLWLGTGERPGCGTALLVRGPLCHCGQSWLGCVHLET